jgi:hypothetical protein
MKQLISFLLKNDFIKRNKINIKGGSVLEAGSTHEALIMRFEVLQAVLLKI